MMKYMMTPSHITDIVT